jgi:hypothetical protein
MMFLVELIHIPNTKPIEVLEVEAENRTRARVKVFRQFIREGYLEDQPSLLRIGEIVEVS